MQKLQSSYAATDAAKDARFEQEARIEERDITRICDHLGLEMIEVSEYNLPLPHLYTLRTYHLSGFRSLPTDIVYSRR
jgi:hypothetical protein